MPFNKNRNSRDDKSGKESKKFNRSESTGKSSSENRSHKSSSSFKKKDDSGFQKDRKPYGDQKENTGDRKPYGSREGSGNSREKKPYGSRSEGTYGDKKPYGTRSEGSGERKSFGAKREGGKAYGDQKPYGSRNQNSDYKKPFSDRKEGSEEQRPFRPKKGGSSFADRKAYGDGKPFTDKKENFGERKPFVSSDRDFGGERKPFRKKEDHLADTNEFNDDQVKLRTRGSNFKSKKESELIRLNRFISNSGICSRRKADELIAAGVVSVNGEVVTELGTKVNPSVDQIRYNGELLKREKMVYVLLNKPKDYITTTDDPQERKTVMELVEKASRERIYPVGRLDRNTTGLLLLTNDGDLADKLSHPKNSISKIYNVELSRNLTQGDFNKIAFGLELEDGFIKPDDIRYVSGGAKNEVGIQIHSGKNRIVRRIFESLGYEVVKLDRVIYANLTKKDLTRGRWRYLTEQEVIQLKHFTKATF
ncbi:MAG: rRNA pseudouridine synthase [Sphingobacteriales bacterium]|nr:rRNA pseudouridine synthase [Sphingobacteriales bacterium]